MSYEAARGISHSMRAMPVNFATFAFLLAEVLYRVAVTGKKKKRQLQSMIDYWTPQCVIYESRIG